MLNFYHLAEEYFALKLCFSLLSNHIILSFKPFKKLPIVYVNSIGLRFYIFMKIIKRMEPIWKLFYLPNTLRNILANIFVKKYTSNRFYIFIHYVFFFPLNSLFTHIVSHCRGRITNFHLSSSWQFFQNTINRSWTKGEPDFLNATRVVHHWATIDPQRYRGRRKGRDRGYESRRAK